MRNVLFFEKSYTKRDRETIPRPFSKKQVENYQNILKLRCRPLAFTSYKAFLKKTKGLELVFLPHFLHDSLKKNISLVIFNYLTKFSCLVAFTS